MKHILLVEDDLSLLNGLSFALKKQGYALEIARTKDEQKQLWAEDKYRASARSRCRRALPDTDRRYPYLHSPFRRNGLQSVRDRRC